MVSSMLGYGWNEVEVQSAAGLSVGGGQTLTTVPN